MVGWLWVGDAGGSVVRRWRVGGELVRAWSDRALWSVVAVGRPAGPPVRRPGTAVTVGRSVGRSVLGRSVAVRSVGW